MSRTFLHSMMTVTLVSTTMLFLLFIWKEYTDFLQYSGHTRNAFNESKKELLQHEVSAVASYIEYRIQQTETNIKKPIKERAERPYPFSQNLFCCRYP